MYMLVVNRRPDLDLIAVLAVQSLTSIVVITRHVATGNASLAHLCLSSQSLVNALRPPVPV